MCGVIYINSFPFNSTSNCFTYLFLSRNWTSIEEVSELKDVGWRYQYISCETEESEAKSDEKCNDHLLPPNLFIWRADNF